MNDFGNLKLSLKNEFKDNLVIVNGKEYVDLDMLKSSVVETCLLDAMLGVIALREGGIKISDKEIDNFISKDFNKTEMIYEDGHHIIKLK